MGITKKEILALLITIPVFTLNTLMIIFKGAKAAINNYIIIAVVWIMIITVLIICLIIFEKRTVRHRLFLHSLFSEFGFILFALTAPEKSILLILTIYFVTYFLLYYVLGAVFIIDKIYYRKFGEDLKYRIFYPLYFGKKKFKEISKTIHISVPEKNNAYFLNLAFFSGQTNRKSYSKIYYKIFLGSADEKICGKITDSIVIISKKHGGDFLATASDTVKNTSVSYILSDIRTSKKLKKSLSVYFDKNNLKAEIMTCRYENYLKSEVLDKIIKVENGLIAVHDEIEYENLYARHLIITELLKDKLIQSKGLLPLIGEIEYTEKPSDEELDKINCYLKNCGAFIHEIFISEKDKNESIFGSTYFSVTLSVNPNITEAETEFIEAANLYAISCKNEENRIELRNGVSSILKAINPGELPTSGEEITIFDFYNHSSNIIKISEEINKVKDLPFSFDTKVYTDFEIKLSEFLSEFNEVSFLSLGAYNGEK